jgi:hypothetical protein
LLAAATLQGAVVAIENQARRIFGLQYHPEVAHTEQGTDTLRHFLLDIAGLTADWSMAEVLETQLKLIEQLVRGAAGFSKRGHQHLTKEQHVLSTGFESCFV